MGRQGLFTVVAVLIVACCSRNPYREQIVGSWQAVEVLEAGSPLGVDPTKIKLSFREDEYYEYYSTLNYREAGHYYLSSRYLYTIDTINQASHEKAVEILLLSTDSLHLRMVEEGKERVLRMIRN